MGYAADDLRNLLSVAKKLRGLAQESPAAADRSLYLAAAVALEARAAWLAGHLPEARYDQEEPVLHRPVDLLV